MMKHCWLPDYTILMMAPGAESHQVKHSRSGISEYCMGLHPKHYQGSEDEKLLPVNFSSMEVVLWFRIPPSQTFSGAEYQNIVWGFIRSTSRVPRTRNHSVFLLQVNFASMRDLYVNLIIFNLLSWQVRGAIHTASPSWCLRIRIETLVE